jgi:hypothetical protein
MSNASLTQLPRGMMIASLALAATLAGLAATTGSAQAAERRGYSVTLAKPLEEAQREIISGAMWRCEGDRCAAPANGERVAALCGKVAKTFGEIARFEGPQGELDAAALAKCNTSAVRQ